MDEDNDLPPSDLEEELGWQDQYMYCDAVGSLGVHPILDHDKAGKRGSEVSYVIIRQSFLTMF